MALYRKKPVVIEAIQFTMDVAKAYFIYGQPGPFGLSVYGTYHKEKKEVYSAHMNIPTLEGTMLAAIDDWIIKGVKNELYPCKPDIFEATYEPA